MLRGCTELNTDGFIVNKRQILNIISIGLLISFCFSATAFAHKVMIFAWVEGDTIHTQSKFSGGKKAVNADILVYNTENKLLRQGKTDQNGEFSFTIPVKSDLRIVLKASMGHQAEWKISSAEITGDPVPAQHKAEYPGKESAGGLQRRPIYVTKEEIRNIVEKTLDRKLDPVVKMLADSYMRGPELKDVIGGIGYIFGLVGLALYCSNRKKND